MRGLIRTTERVLVPPACEPIDLALAKKNVRFGSTSEDLLIQGWIVAARQYFEQATGQQIIAAVWEYGVDAAPCGTVIELPHPPLLEVLSFTYLDAAGDEQTVDAADYQVSAAGVGSPPTVTDPFAKRGTLAIPYGASWPTVTTQANALRIQYRAGYGSTVEDVPELVKAVLYDLVRHFHRRSNDDLSMTTQVMLRMFRQASIDTIALERATLSEAW